MRLRYATQLRRDAAYNSYQVVRKQYKDAMERKKLHNHQKPPSRHVGKSKGDKIIMSLSSDVSSKEAKQPSESSPSSNKKTGAADDVGKSSPSITKKTTTAEEDAAKLAESSPSSSKKTVSEEVVASKESDGTGQKKKKKKKNASKLKTSDSVAAAREQWMREMKQKSANITKDHPKSKSSDVDKSESLVDITLAPNCDPWRQNQVNSLIAASPDVRPYYSVVSSVNIRTPKLRPFPPPTKRYGMAINVCSFAVLSNLHFPFLQTTTPNTNRHPNKL